MALHLPYLAECQVVKSRISAQLCTPSRTNDIAGAVLPSRSAGRLVYREPRQACPWFVPQGSVCWKCVEATGSWQAPPSEGIQGELLGLQHWLRYQESRQS